MALDTLIDEIVKLAPPGFNVKEWIDQKIIAEMPAAMRIWERGNAKHYQTK